MIEVQELIDRAKTYVDDEHRSEDAWISAERWLSFFNTERRNLYKRGIRAGFIQPPIEQQFLTALTTELSTGVLAIVGVGKDIGGTIQLLPNASQRAGRDPFWRSATATSTPGSCWKAYGNGTTVTVELDGISDLAYSPGPPITCNYLVRYVPVLAAVTDPTTEVDLPDGGDERIVLGMARRSLIKESGASRRLDQEILDADAELNLAWHAAVGGIKLRPTPKGKQLTLVSPNRWIYFF